MKKKYQLKAFPSQKYFIFAVIQIFTGLVLSVIPFDEYSWVRALFEPIDQNFRAFRTMPLNVSNPTAGKVMLLLWWIFFIPWGVLWAGRFTGWFKPAPLMLNSKIASAKCLILSSVVGFAVVYLNAFAAHGDANIGLNGVRNRADFIPFVLAGGAFTLSIWLAICSFLLVMMAGGLCLSIRALIHQFIYKEI